MANTSGERLQRLDADLRANDPLYADVSVGLWSDKTTWLVNPPSQQVTAQPIIDAFDTSPAAQDSWENSEARANAISAYDDNRDRVWKALRAAADLIVTELTTVYQAMPRPIASLTRVTTVATATTPTAHGLSNSTVFVFGADQAAYSGAKAITVTGATTFTFAVAGNPTTPATGTILYALSADSPPIQRTLPQAIQALKNTINAGNVD